MKIFITICIFFLLLFMGLKDQNAFWAKILRRISAFIGIGIPLTILFFALLVLLSPLSEEEYVCNGFRPNLTTCFTVKKGDSFYDPGISEDGFIKGGTYFKIGEDEPYSGCAIYGYDYFDGHSGSMCFENGKPNGVWSYWKNEYNELEKDVCYIKGKKQRNLSKCD